MSVNPGTPVNRPEVGLPPNDTTLEFGATATSPARINVRYAIQSPANVLFANGTREEHLRDFLVDIDDTRVPKDVSFTFTGARPQTTIRVDGSVTAPGGSSFTVHWSVTVRALPVPLDEVHLKLDDIIDRLAVIESHTKPKPKRKTAPRKGRQ